MSTPPSKQVRFDPNDTTWSFVEEDSASSEEVEPEQAEVMSSPLTRSQSTPSPTHSVSTVSTDGPFTPPAAGPTLRFGSLSLEPNSPERESSTSYNRDRVYPHPLLIHPNGDIRWDILDHEAPSSRTIPVLKYHGSEKAIVFNPQRFTHITFVSPLIPQWPLYVDIREITTLSGLMEAIHDHLHQPSNEDLTHNRNANKIWEAYSNRRQNKGITTAEPLRRVDYFLGRCTFRGLEEVEGDPCGWEIVIV